MDTTVLNSLQARTRSNPPRADWPSLLARPHLELEHLQASCKEVFAAVGQGGDQALLDYTAKFDKVELAAVRVPSTALQQAAGQLSEELKAAIKLAKQNIEAFHAAQRESSAVIETMPGVQCWRKSLPIEKVGLYIPGGSAPLFSTVLMLAVPAQLAGCKHIVLCSPPTATGLPHPAVLYTAQLCGVTEVFALGGMQAIAGLALGTESLPAVDKLFGPGNQYVTAAKQYAQQHHGVAIDMPAGPSEVLVIADSSTPAAFTAADLLAQAEHGPDSQVVLLTTEQAYLNEVLAGLEQQLATLHRAEIARKALENSHLLHFGDESELMAFCNAYAPEHLIIATRNSEQLVEQVVNAGSVFIGPYTPESVGDYASGTNHTLPTGGWARSVAGVSLDSFVKKVTYQQLTPAGLQALGPAVERMAQAEELEGHRQAVSIRLQQLKGGHS